MQVFMIVPPGSEVDVTSDEEPDVDWYEMVVFMYRHDSKTAGTYFECKSNGRVQGYHACPWKFKSKTMWRLKYN